VATFGSDKKYMEFDLKNILNNFMKTWGSEPIFSYSVFGSLRTGENNQPGVQPTNVQFRTVLVQTKKTAIFLYFRKSALQKQRCQTAVFTAPFQKCVSFTSWMSGREPYSHTLTNDTPTTGKQATARMLETAKILAATGTPALSKGHQQEKAQPQQQCSGSMKFWGGSGSGDPCL
jgi:hypothetical protein